MKYARDDKCIACGKDIEYPHQGDSASLRLEVDYVMGATSSRLVTLMFLCPDCTLETDLADCAGAILINAIRQRAAREL